MSLNFQCVGIRWLLGYKHIMYNEPRGFYNVGSICNFKSKLDVFLEIVIYL